MNHSATKKFVRKTLRKNSVNTMRKSRIKSYISKFLALTEVGDKDAANSMLRTVQSELMRGVSKGLIMKNTASRKISRFSKMICKMS